jgi:hypothetical protein
LKVDAEEGYAQGASISDADAVTNETAWAWVVPVKLLPNPDKIYLGGKLNSVGTEDILHLKHGLCVPSCCLFIRGNICKSHLCQLSRLREAWARWIILD